MITVVMSTYSPTPGSPREDYARRAVEALGKYLHSPVPLRLHVADDGSADGSYLRDLLRISHLYGWQEGSITVANRKGIGGSLNRALALSQPAIWLYTTDDWLLTAPLDLTQPIKLLDTYGLLRIGPTHPNLACHTRFREDIGWWLEIDARAGGFAFATRIFLATWRFYEAIGPFDEGLNAYETERLYAERVKAVAERDGQSGLIAQIGTQSLAGPWEHLGEFEVGTIQP